VSEDNKNSLIEGGVTLLGEGHVLASRTASVEALGLPRVLRIDRGDQELSKDTLISSGVANLAELCGVEVRGGVRC